MTFKESGRVVKINQDLLFKRPYIWIVTLSITSLNFLITYNFQNINIQYVYYYLVDILTTYLIIEFYAYGVRFLNKKIPLNKDFVKRLTYQFTLHTLTVVIFTILLNELLDHIFFGGKRLSLSFVFYTKDTFVALLFILLFHAVYFGLFLVSERQNPGSVGTIPEVKIKVRDAFTFKLLSTTEIIAVYSLFGNTYVIDINFKKFSSELTLKEFEEKLNENFFRANRKFIISKTIIDSYKSASNGKIDVTIKTKATGELSKTITVSRDKASLFRTWLKSGS
ncbi:LytTR family DNA-binding domain-containing protein [Fulvivirgaceae bacterium BMA12]|uniref:LytTR family DNA-binding domain-containing protein n=1 Tax=Agaribacillus aureus TaxID=3051825 RepID=A0ABT8LA73_9BACT|nr:LytTR family DNA-binding domain-containing protein [Fulvivirgaceae bacterium BMA12]